MPNKSTERGLELKKRAFAIPYHTQTSKNDFRAILSPVFKILEIFIISLDKITEISYNFHAFKKRKDEKNENANRIRKNEKTLRGRCKGGHSKRF